MTRVLLADDQPLVRTGFRMILDAEPDIEVAGDGADAVRQCRAVCPDVVDPAVTRRLLDHFTRPRPPAWERAGGEGADREAACRDRLRSLTGREIGVLELVARGLSNAEIAAGLMIAETTLKTHVLHLLTKLGARDRVQLVIFAYDAGMVRSPS